MTCLAALRHRGKVWMGGDGCESLDGGFVAITEPKVWRAGKYIIGHCGDGRACQLIKHTFEPPEYNGGGMVFMVSEFVPPLLELINGFQGEDDFDVGLLVGINSRLFEIDGDGCVTEKRYTATMGSGGAIALGNLEATADLPPRDRIEAALIASAKHRNDVSEPFTIMRTR